MARRRDRARLRDVAGVLPARRRGGVDARAVRGAGDAARAARAAGDRRRLARGRRRGPRGRSRAGRVVPATRPDTGAVMADDDDDEPVAPPARCASPRSCSSRCVCAAADGGASGSTPSRCSTSRATRATTRSLRRPQRCGAPVSAPAGASFATRPYGGRAASPHRRPSLARVRRRARPRGGGVRRRRAGGGRTGHPALVVAQAAARRSASSRTTSARPRRRRDAGLAPCPMERTSRGHEVVGHGVQHRGRAPVDAHGHAAVGRHGRGRPDRERQRRRRRAAPARARVRPGRVRRRRVGGARGARPGGARLGVPRPGDGRRGSSSTRSSTAPTSGATSRRTGRPSKAAASSRRWSAPAGGKGAKDRLQLFGLAASADAALGGRIARGGVVTLYGRARARRRGVVAVPAVAGRARPRGVARRVHVRPRRAARDRVPAHRRRRPRRPLDRDA